LNFKEDIFLKDFKPAHYRIRVALLDSEQELLSEGEEFDVTSVSTMPRPWVYYKRISPSSDPIYTFILGRQFLNKGETDKAQVLFEKAYHTQPNSLNYALLLAQTYFIQKKFGRVKQILIPFIEKPEIPYMFYLLLGGSYHKLGELSQAINIYDEAISRFGINIKLLNSLGECYYLLGNVKEALAAWEKSLELKPDQAEIKKKIESIKK
jgi:tetratricopeptide (TPR) repeat protein